MGKRVLWNNDRRRSKSSIEVLLEWLADGSNMVRWQSGIEPKSRLTKEIVLLLRAQELRHRTPKQVQYMIGQLLRSMDEAHKLLVRAGATTLDGVNEAARDQILGICPYFEQIAAVTPLHPRESRTKREQLQEVPANKSPEERTDEPRSAPIDPSPDVEIQALTGVACAAKDEDPSVDDTPAEASMQTHGLIELQRMRLQEQVEHQRKTQKLELELRKSELIVERALGKDRLRQAGISESVFDRVLPRIKETRDWNALL